jgi:hypothetical protein
MPSHDSWDYLLNSWRTTGSNAKAKEKDRIAAQKQWLEAQIKSASGSITYYENHRDEADTGITTFLGKISTPPKDTNYVTTFVGGDYVEKELRSYYLNNGSATFPSEYSGIGGGEWDKFVARTNAVVNAFKATIKADDAEILKQNNLLSVYQAALDQIVYTGKSLGATIFADVVKGKGGKLTKIIDSASQTFVYNVSGVTENYFKSTETFTYELKNNKYQVMGSNAPSIVKSAGDLWSDSNAHKGMIASVDYKKLFQNNNPDSAFGPNDPIVPSSTSRETKDGNTTVTNTQYTSYDWQFDLDAGKKYAFQFLYNPGTVDMTFMGTPDVDVGYEISGSDQFSLIGGIGMTQSTISFDLVLNRMFDMKYYDSKTERLKSPFNTNPKQIYPGRTPTYAEQQLIYRRGTMYDVDYLLRTLLGYKGPTTLRFGGTGISDVGTADIGYLGALPVELHLGQNLRYLGIVNSLSVRHVVFNERMVPLFSTLRVQFNRIPDFA